MQIAAMNPKYITEKDVPEAVIEKEKEIYRAQMKDSGKPAQIIEKIIEGKLKKFYSEVCLLHQNFFKEEKKTIEDLVAEKSINWAKTSPSNVLFATRWVKNFNMLIWTRLIPSTNVSF